MNTIDKNYLFIELNLSMKVKVSTCGVCTWSLQYTPLILHYLS